MRLWQYGVGFVLALDLGLAAGAGCAAGGTPATGAAGTGGSSSSSTGNGGGFVTSSSSSGGDDASVPDGFGACAKFNAEAKQAPAAMLVVLDRSASMSQVGKWGTAQLALVQAIDKDVFDTMSMGMSLFPSGYTGAPDCLCPGGGPTCFGLLPQGVACGYPTLPQIQIQPAGTDKSAAATGVRHAIYQSLVSTQPETADPSDASPIYDSLAGAYAALKTVSIDKRIVILITDGGGSCTSLSARSGTAFSDGMCPDWENPAGMNQLISGARTDPSQPINTFIVGVPGSNSLGQQQGPYATAPYSMLLALSTYAVSGSPDTVDPACDKALAFSKTGTDPAHPCHIDLSNGGSFNATALSDAISAIRGKALGCTYDLPKPPPGETIDPGQVNVIVTLDGTDYTIPRRTDPADTCEALPCWDYDAQGKVQLIGVTCEQVGIAKSAKVEIVVGCGTILK
jgi:hypothetical protein